MNLTAQQKAIGKENFQTVLDSDLTRRDFLKGGLAASVVAGAGLGAMYFGYQGEIGNPLRVGFIGTGDEGNVLINAITPSYIQVVAIADIRPYNVWRAFHGDHSTESALKNRCGLMTKYGWQSEDEARKNVKVYAEDYHDLLKDPAVEAVVIALPLHLHAPVAIEAMKAGKHVITEKLMGHSVHECKEMGRVAKQTDKILVTGHQRHYSILYDDAVHTIRQGLIGDIHFIRAQWHRGNLPDHDSWQPLLPGDKKLADQLKKTQEKLSKADPKDVNAMSVLVAQLEAQLADAKVNAESYGYQKGMVPGKVNFEYSALEELIRWRLFNRTGGGLMAELGSHQLDASGIFISAMSAAGEKALPLTVTAVGGRHIFSNDRDCEDHVYCTYEFQSPKYPDDPEKKIVVTYSSINGNEFGGYGEVVLGTQGTLILEREQEAMLFKNADTATKVSVTKDKTGAAVLDTTQSGGGEAAVAGKARGPVSKGYTEELEHWAYCIRHRDASNQPRCHPKIALGDAVIALTTNIAIRERKPIEFKHEWFDIDSDETPEGIKPDLSRYA